MLLSRPPLYLSYHARKDSVHYDESKEKIKDMANDPSYFLRRLYFGYLAFDMAVLF